MAYNLIVKQNTDRGTGTGTLETTVLHSGTQSECEAQKAIVSGAYCYTFDGEEMAVVEESV